MLLNSSRITDDFKKLTFASFITDGKTTEIVQLKKSAATYYEKFNFIKNTRHNSICFLGQPGTGKTHLLIAIANNMIVKRTIEVVYFPYVDGFNDLKSNFDVLEKKLERLKDAEILLIDDLFKPSQGEPRATPWQLEQMYNIINHRYLNHLPIMVSSELEPRELINVDEALASRILEMCKDFTKVIKKNESLNYRFGGVEW